MTAPGHNHGHGVAESNERRVLLALGVTALFLVAEVVGGLLANSLVLLADAGHMLTDVLALGLAWVSFRVARRSPDPRRSYGYHRFPVLAAYTNGVALFFVAGAIAYEAAHRLFVPPEEIRGGILLVVAVAGLIANLVCYAILARGGGHDLNVRGAALHVLGDLLGSVAAIGAAGIILLTGWGPIDPILSVAVCLLILRGAWDLVARSGHILMQGTPPGLELDLLRSDLLEAVPELEDVHHVHVWELTEGKPVISLHVRVRPGADQASVLPRIKEILGKRFDLRHSAVQVEGAQDGCRD